MSRSLANAFLAACLLGGVASGLAVAQGPATEAIGFGGRVEVPEAGYAVTLPDDWVHVRPTAADTGAIIDAVRAIAPDLATMVEAGMARGASVSLIAFGPIGADAAFVVNCNVVDSPSGGLTLDLRVAAEVAAYRALGDVVAAGPEVTKLDLPGGEVVRLDARLDLPGYQTASSSYVSTDGRTFHTLTCTDLAWPEDRWLSIAGTFELLGAE
jgi:hypothetical protein